MRNVLWVAVVLAASGCGGGSIDVKKQRIPEGSRYAAWPDESGEMLWVDFRTDAGMEAELNTKVRSGDEVIVVEDSEPKMWPRLVRARAMTGECAGRIGVIPVAWLRPIPR